MKICMPIPGLAAVTVRAAPLGAPLILLALAACQQTDPSSREGLWRPVGANDTNLRAMIADPADLVLGKAAARSRGDTAAAAVVRLRADAVKPLPDSAISSVRVSGAGASQPGAAGAGTAADPVAAAPASAAGGS